MPTCHAHCKSTGLPCSNPQVSGSRFCFSHCRLKLDNIKLTWKKISDLLYHVDVDAMVQEHGRIRAHVILSQALQHPVTRFALSCNDQLDKVCMVCQVPAVH